MNRDNLHGMLLMSERNNYMHYTYVTRPAKTNVRMKSYEFRSARIMCSHVLFLQARSHI